MSKVLATTRQRVLYRAREIWRAGFVTFDSETTGLEWEDQIIQWAICDQEGNILGSGYVRPTVEISEGAFEVHGIRDEDLAEAPSFVEMWPTIHELLKDRIVVIYNADFDLGKLWSSARAYELKINYDAIQTVCAMDLFAQFYGEVHEYWGTYTWQSLNEVAVPHLGIVVPGQAHDAAHDATATAMIIKRLAELADQELPAGWHPPVLVKCAGNCGSSQECAESNEIWHCQSCSLELGLYHRCPACNHIVEAPAASVPCEDICEYCQKKLHQEMMLLIGAWHWCPDHWYPYIVETPDLEEPCEHCARQRKWKRQAEEAERERQAKLEQGRKERRRAYAKAYRQRRKERDEENSRRAEMGLPPLEIQKTPPVGAIFIHHGHQFQRRKDQHGRPEVYCFRCDASWSRPPNGWCAGIKAYRSWTAIPPHLKTRTQLLKEHLKPADGQKTEAVMEGYFDRYSLYDKNACVQIEHKLRAREKAVDK